MKLVAGATAVVALAAAVVGLITDWYGLQETRKCSVSGRVVNSLSSTPAGGVRVLWSSDPSGLIAVSDADGSFEGSCEGADAFGERVQLFTVGQFQGGGLPCLSPTATGVWISTKGKNDGRTIRGGNC